jgi:hypothetical protein
MAGKPPRKAKQERLPATPLDEQTRALEEEARKLKAKMERYKQLIEKAPELKKQRDRQVRDQLITQRSRTTIRPTSHRSLPDIREDEELVRNVIPVRPTLRSERAQGRTLFFILLFILVGVMGWLYFTINNQ